ncbi:MAG: InlB B-repeat-containing protein, partial [Clostridia bacterium]|nr:InlB B-repeat-containing protein [Clostridia bacterium]
INTKISNHLQLLDLEFYLDEDFTKLVYSIKETSEGVFVRSLDDAGNNDFIINDDITIYAKWVAKECKTANSTKSVTIRFNKTDRDIYNNFNLNEAISSVTLFNDDSNIAVVAFLENQIKEYTEIDGVLSIVFNVNTDRSDVLTNFKQIMISLQNGYSISENTTITYTVPDADFGSLKSDIKNNTEINLYNLLNDIIIDVTLQVSEISNNLSIDNDLYLALAPEQSVTTDGIYLYVSGVYQRAENILGVEEGAYNELYFGYDFVKQAFLSSKTGENWSDKVDAPVSVFNRTDGNYCIYVRYGVGSTAKYYCYEYAYTDTTWTCSLYECQQDRTKVGMLARFNKLSGSPAYGSNLPTCEYSSNNTTISRLSSSAFVMITSTEDETKVISDFTNFEDDRSGTRETQRLVVSGSGVSPNKLMTIFREDKDYTLGLNFKTQYTEAYVSFSFASYNDKNKNFEKLEELTPVVEFVDGGPNYSILQNGTIKFSLTPSSNYNLANISSSSSVLLLYSSTGVELSKVSLKLQVTNTGDAAFEEAFNNNNSNYISANYNSDGTVSLSYTAGTLISGHYEIVVICEDVDYTINYDVVYTNSTKNLSVESLDNDEVNSGILVSINGTTTADNVQLQYHRGLKYQDKVEIETEFGQNSYGYTFVGWQLGERVFTNLSSAFSFDFASYYQQYGANLELTIKAIYLRRTVDVSLANVARVEGSSENVKCSDIDLSLNGQTGYSLEYTFSKSEREINLNFVKQNGGVANAYYFSGFDLVYLSGGRYISVGSGVVNETATNASISENFDIFNVLNTAMQKEENRNISNYYIMPVLSQKEIQIYVHSGTGDAENLYGDQKYGSVTGSYGDMVGYDVNNQFFTKYFLIDDARVFYSSSKTEIELNFASGYTGYMFLNGQKSNVQSVINPALLYTQRVGYFVPNFTGFWSATSENSDREFTLSGNSLVLPNFFTNSPNENLVKIHVYRAWEAYYYYINFNISEEGGTVTAGNTLSSVLATYDMTVDNTNILNKNQVFKTGYEFDGWYYKKADGTSVKIFDANSDLVDNEVLFNELGEYKTTSNVDLYAHFETLKYNVRIFVNGATEIEGNDITGESDYLEHYYLFEDVVYDSRFVNSSGIKLFDLLKNLRITRKGFDLSGLYATNGGQVQLISESTIFDVNILSVNLNSSYALDLYVMWQYDETSLQLGFVDDNFANRNYNPTDKNQMIYIAEILKDNLNLVGFDIEIDASETQFKLTPVGVDSASLVLSLTSSGAETYVDQLGENFMAYFIVNSAGNYTVTLNVRVNDNSNYLSLGSLFNQDYTLYLTVNKVGVDFNLTTAQNNQIRLANVKAIVEPFVSSEVMSNVNSKNDFEEIMKALGEKYLIRAQELDTKEKIQDMLYRYLMYKYYNLTVTNDGTTYLQFKNDYEYYDFEESYFDIDEHHEYVNKQTIDNIVESLNFFESNDYALSRNIMEVNKYDGNLALNTPELTIEKVMFYSSNTNGLVPKSTAVMRIYVSEVVSGSLENYNYNSDENGNYINYNSYVYVMPKILKITNIGAKSSYFEQNIARKTINWKTESSITYNNETYYLADSDDANLYVKANLYTSNAGNSDSDTEFSFVGKENFLYFSGISILLENNGNYVDVSNYYKLVLDENDVYTILSVAGVAKVTLNATYLTLENGEPVRGNLADLENYNLLSLLSVSSVSYAYKYDETNVVTGTISGTNLVVGDNTIQVPSSENANVLVPVTICVIEQNSDNSISVYLNRWVTKAEFSLSQTTIDNFALYEWCLNENRTYSVGGTMESRNGITVVPTFDGQKNNVEISSSTKVFEIDVDSENGLNTTDICAVFTDLVYVAYDYNLPQELISNLSLASGTNLKLNSSTLADLKNSYPDNITGVGGLMLSDFTISWDGVNFYDPSEVFAGSDDNSIFQGRTGNAHTALTVKSVWTISELTATQNITDLQVAVQSLGSLLASDVVSVSANENLYDFIYKWEREIDGEWTEIEVEKPDVLTFANGGTSKDSGNYRLTISVKTKDILDGYVEDKVLSETYDFDILFKKHLVSEIILPSSLTDEYTSSDILLTNSSKTAVTISYKQWQNESGKYGENTQTSTQNYLTKGSLQFNIKYFADEDSVGESVTEMISAGRYVFTVTPNTEIFELDESLANTFEFEYVVTPCQIEISEIGSLAWSKTFHNSDPAMEIVHTYGNDTITLKFEREEGERTTYVDLSGNKVNLYKVYLASVEGVELSNYAFYYHGALIDLSSESKMAVGSFTINAGGTLVVSYEITEELPKALAETYSGGVYTLEFDAEGNFVIKLNDVAVYTINPVLYDNLKGNVSGEYLEILKGELQNISAYFASSNNVYPEGVSNVSTYTYKFEVGDFSRYYTAVEFDGSYSFVINKKIIDVSELNTITKVFDNNNTTYVDLDGNTITDLNSYTGAYLIATYSTVHAGNNITISLELDYKGENADVYLANYALSARSTTGVIEKTDATLTINLDTTLDASNFVYGKILNNNLSQLVNSENPVTLQVGGVNRTNWLDMLYCTLIYNTDADVSSNGFVYAGTHTLTATNSVFNDFNITNIVGAEFTISPYQFEYEIPANLFIENTTNVVKDVYSTTVSVTGLGESVELQFEIDDETFEKNEDGTSKQAGTYHLSLVGSDHYSNNSVHVTISNLETNKGMTIVAETNVLYLVVEDVSDLSQYYNNGNYNLQLLFEEGKYVLQISSDDTDFVTRKLATHLQNSAGQTVDVEDISGVVLALNMSVKQANKYKLALTFTGSNILYTNFISEQFFTVEKVKIDVESATFKQSLKKQYDGTYTKTITTFNEKVDGSTVSILVNYNNDPNAGQKDATLLLQGSDSQNYELVFKDETQKVVGEILKADATILFTHNYSYGELSTSKNANSFGVEFSVVLSSNRDVKITQYTVSSFNVLNPKTSGTYLCVGTYNVEIEISAINYNINFESSDLNGSGDLDLKIVVGKLESELILNRNGGVSAQYMSTETLTAQFTYSDISDLREQFTLTLERDVNENDSLTDVGYYRVKTGYYTDNSGNYLFHVVDNSENGFYQITISTETQYLLLAENGNEVNEQNVVTTISTQYLGVQFDTVAVKYSEELGLYLEISNSKVENSEKITKQLAFYTYNTENKIYKKNNINVANLNVELNFYSSFVKNVGNYGIYSLSSSSGNYEIHAGKSGDTICFTLAVTERILTFKDTTLEKSFDNRPASMTYQGYDQLSTIVSGALVGEELGLLVEFYDGANLALHTKSGLTVKATLTKPNGSSISLANYKLTGLNSEGVVSGVTGSIIRAGLTVVVDTQKFVYGQIMQTGGVNTNINSLDLVYTCQPDFDYDQQLKLDFVISLPNGVDDFSSARLLKAGNYNMTISGNFDDFEISTVVLNGTTIAYNPTLYIPLRVERKTLTARSLTSQSLSEILTKAYDGNKSININGLVGLSEIEIDDVVLLAGAEYESSHIGSTVLVNFILEETGDFANYTVAQAVGSITPIIINITYNDNTPSGVTVTSPTQRVTEIKFPLSGTNLTTNSNNASTSGIANFPSTLGGWEGHYLLGWAMNFENIETTSAEYNFLKNYGTYNSATKTITVSVDNDVKTVNFLNALLNDTNGLFANAYYYKGKANVGVTFDAVWDVLKYNVSVKVTDRDGSTNTGLGSFDVVITDENGQTTKTSLKNETIAVAYGASITITAHANDHCDFRNIYNRTDNVTSNFAETYTLTDVKKNYDIWVSFTVEEMNVVLDLSEYSDDITISGGRGLNFTKNENVFTATVDYLSFEKLKFSNLPNISTSLYNLAGWNDGNTVVSVDDFDSTTLSSLLPSGNTLTLYAKFVVVITLNYNDGITSSKTVNINYGDKYLSNTAISTEPTREGYDFAGWYVGENLIDATTNVSDAKAHTIVAGWTIKKYNIKITAQNATIESEKLTKTGDIYTANMEYSGNLTFAVYANNGYEISETGWSREFNLISFSKSQATVVLVVPAKDVEFTIPVVPLSNHVTLSWNGYVDNVVVTNTTDNETLTLDRNNTFRVVTGKVVQIVITPEIGYTLTEDITFSKQVQYTANINKGVLTLTISNIDEDMDIDFVVTEGLNTVTFSLGDDLEAYNTINILGRNYTSDDFVDGKIEVSALTNSTLNVSVRFNHGFMMNSCVSVRYDISNIQQVVESGNYVLTFNVSSIAGDSDVVITTKRLTYNVNLQVVAFDSNGNMITTSLNDAEIDGYGKSVTNIEFGKTVTLKLKNKESGYSFVGFGDSVTNGDYNILSSAESYIYTVQDNVTVYAVFSTRTYYLSFDVAEYYRIEHTLNGEPAFDVVEKFDTFPADTIVDLNGNALPTAEVKLGMSVTVMFKPIEGYRYYGLGIMENGILTPVEATEHNIKGKVEITISSKDIGSIVSAGSDIVDIVFLVTSYEVSIDVGSYIYIDGDIENDNYDPSAGEIFLQDEEGNLANKFGYVSGTRIHYLSNTNNNSHFSVIAYTGNEVYLKVSVVRRGYTFYDFISNDQNVSIEFVSEQLGNYVYKISGLVGGLGQNVSIMALFKPQINIINLSFNNDADKVNAGAIVVEVDSFNSNKVYNTGNNYSSTVVSAYTDSKFAVSAYVRLGYHVDVNNLVSSDPDIVLSNIRFASLSVENTGYTGVVTFDVSDFFGNNNLQIQVLPTTYTVNLIGEDKTLAKIKNVEYDSILDLSSNNTNIEIIDNSVRFENGKLQLVMQKTNYNFEGYFTYSGGSGVQYINSEGNVIKYWQETGYVFNGLTSRYELSNNATVTNEEIEINLYLYFSYFKTRFNFEFVPDISISYTAENIISGVDYSNSWFYGSSPLYMEVAFDTQITITAPNLNGYKFYKFEIIEKDK